MRFRIAAIALLTALMTASAGFASPQGHMVFFTLAEPSAETRDALVAKCHEHLSEHEGVIYFSVGVVAEDRQRAVNDRSFDVALHLVFDSPEAHDTYQDHPRHLRFIKEAKSLWSKVRVFDSNLAPPAASTAPQGE